MVNAGHAFRGTRVGSGESSTRMGGAQSGAGQRPDASERTVITYWCGEGHQTRPVFAKLTEDEIPAVWQCSRCGAPAGRTPGAELDVDGDEPFKSHLQYVKERRTAAEAARVLDEALRRLREGPG